MYPPSTGSAIPFGMYGDAIQVSGLSFQMSCASRGSICAASHGCTPTTPATQPAAPS